MELIYLHHYSLPQHVVSTLYGRAVTIESFRPRRTRTIHDFACVVRRKSLPRSRVNRATRRAGATRSGPRTVLAAVGEKADGTGRARGFFPGVVLGSGSMIGLRRVRNVLVPGGGVPRGTRLGNRMGGVCQPPTTTRAEARRRYRQGSRVHHHQHQRHDGDTRSHESAEQRRTSTFSALRVTKRGAIRPARLLSRLVSPRTPVNMARSRAGAAKSPSPLLVRALLLLGRWGRVD
jgi:hypothetical protein